MPVPPWFNRQAAAIPYRRGPEGLEFLLVTTRRRGHWIIPKGVIDPGRTAEQAALQEALEEAGVSGSIETPEIGRYEYEKWSMTCAVRVFLLRVDRVDEDWPEADVRRRAWLPAREAIARVNRHDLARLLEEARARLEPGPPPVPGDRTP